MVDDESGSEHSSVVARLGPLVSTEPACFPSKLTTLHGTYVDLVPLEAAHADELYPLVGLKEHERLWDYMMERPFDGDQNLFREHIRTIIQRSDMVFFAVIDKSGAPESRRLTGYLSFLRIEPTHRVIEIGNLMFSSLMQRTRMATEAIFLIIAHGFELGYRRVEWKCNDLNGPSKKAALRFGFTYEGLFRQAVIIKGRSRDTAWFSIIDEEWPNRRQAFERWLCAENFDEGRQKKTLAQIREELSSSC